MPESTVSTDSTVWITTLRASHDRVVAMTSDLSDAALDGPSYDTEWTVAQVLSHLGSGAEIFGLRLDAGLRGLEAPDIEVCRPIWDKWDSATPTWQRDESIVANERLVSTIEGMSAEDRETFDMDLFGRQVDLAGFVGMRLSEHAVHAWDVAVAFDPSAVVAPDAVALLTAQVPGVAGWSSKAAATPFRVRVKTTDPVEDVVISVGDTDRSATISPAVDGEAYDGEVELPAEAYLRLVYGRLDDEHAPPVTESGARGLSDLRAVFKGL